MRATWHDPRLARIATRDVDELSDITPLLEDEALATERGRPMIVVERPADHTALGIALVPGGAVVSHLDAEQRWHHAVGNGHTTGTVAYDYLGTHTEVPAADVIAIDIALDAMTHYLQRGDLTGSTIALAPDD